MRSPKIIIVFLILAGLALTGFQCASTELTSAKLYIQQKNYDKALEVLEKEVEKNPKSDEGYYLLGVVYAEKDQTQKMVDAFNKSLAISKQYEQQINDYKKSQWANSFNRGVNYFNKATSTDSEDSAKVFYDQSISAFNTAVILEPDSGDAYKNLAFVYMSKGDYDQAMVPLEKLIAMEESLDGYKFLGEILYNKGMQTKSQDSTLAQEYFTKAIKILEDGRQKYPNDSEILLTLSNSYIAADKIDVAIDAFKAGVEQDPQNKFYRYNYGVLLLGGSNYEAAEDQFLKAIEIDPNYQNALYNLAVTYVRWGAEINKKSEESGQMDNQAYKEKFQSALSYLEKVVELKPDDAQMWETLGRVYTVLGMQDKATDAFGKADSLR